MTASRWPGGQEGAARRRVVAIGAGLVLGAAVNAFGPLPILAETTPADPAAFIAEFLQLGVELSRAYPPLDPEASRAWRSLVADFLDVRLITRFVTGPAWRSATPEQRQRLIEVVEKRLADLCAARIREEGDSGFEVLNTAPLAAEDMLVTTRHSSAGRAPATLSWRVRADEAGLRILDIVSNGSSLMATKRAEYLATFQRFGGDVDDFIAALQGEAATQAD